MNVLGKIGLLVFYLRWEFEEKEVKDWIRNNGSCIYGYIKF